MQVATRELCQKLFEVSGWNDTDYIYPLNGTFAVNVNQYVLQTAAPITEDDLSAYDLGFMLRKLPVGHCYKLLIDQIGYGETRKRVYWYQGFQEKRMTDNCDAPEDATAKLCIALFEQGILTREV